MRIFARLTITLFLIAACSLQAQTNITISGEITDGAGKKVSLYRYSDMLTCTEVLLDQAEIAENDNFQLHAYANYPTMMILQIESYSQSFFVEPGRNYEVYLPEFDWDINEKKNVYLDPVALPLQFLDMPSNDLNALISNFEAVVAQYLDSHRVWFDSRFRPKKRYFDSLLVEVSKKAPDTKNEYFNRYKRYQLASLKYSMHFDSRRNLMNEYIKGQPILYYDDNYMAFFTTLFANSVSKGTKVIPAWQLGHWVNTLNLSVFIDSLGTDTLLRHEQVREIVALQALQEAFYQPRYYEADKVVKMIEMIGAQSKFPDHKILAQHLIESLKIAEEGSAMPSFTLPNVDKEPVSLDSLKGKWVYISFVRVGDPNCVGEIETMAHFYDTIRAQYPNVEFVTVCCDREIQKMYHFLNNTKKGRSYNWPWLHFDGNYDLLQYYGVVAYPHFILLNPEGNLQYSVTPAPASGFLMRGPWIPKQNKSNESEASFLRY